MKISIKQCRAIIIGLTGLCSALAINAQTVVFHETFGTSPNRVSSPYVPKAFPNTATEYYTFSAANDIPDGAYTITRPQNLASLQFNYWVDLPTDHSGDPAGALLVLNAGDQLTDFYRRNFDIRPGYSYEVSVWRYVVNGNEAITPVQGPVSWKLELREVNSDTLLTGSQPLYNTNRGSWEESIYRFSVPMNCGSTVPGGIQAAMALKNNEMIAQGNDFYVDDIKVTETPFDPALPQSACPTERSVVNAIDNAVSTLPATPVDINVAGNDTTPTGTTLGAPVIELAPTPSMGTATVNPDGTIRFTPAPGFAGEASFTYRICNNTTPVPACDSATVRVTVPVPPNTVPVASSVSTGSTPQVGTTLPGLYTYTDAERDAESSSTFRWLSGSTANIVNATQVASTRTYTPTASDIGNYLFFCVTPVAGTGASPGAEVCSPASGPVAAAGNPSVQPVPTLSEWAMVAISSLLAFAGTVAFRRRNQ